jgi:hypothetical protein
MFFTACLAFFLSQIIQSYQLQQEKLIHNLPPDSYNLTNDHLVTSTDTSRTIPFASNNYDNANDDNLNTTICSDLSGGDLTTFCRFWVQGVLLFVVGLFGVVGNSVSYKFSKFMKYRKKLWYLMFTNRVK